MHQSWDCLQVKNEPEEKDAMDWLVDDEMVMQWDKVSEEEEEIAVDKSESRKF